MQVKQDFLVRLEDTGKGFVLSNKGFLIMLTNLACIHGTRIGQGLMDRCKEPAPPLPERQNILT